MPLAICRLLTEGRGGWRGAGAAAGPRVQHAAACTLLPARCSHTAAARTPLAWLLLRARCVPLARLTPAAPHAAPLHGCWGLLHARWGLLHGRQPVHAAPGTPLRAACLHGRRAPPPQAACTAQRPFWEQPPAPRRTGPWSSQEGPRGPHPSPRSPTGPPNPTRPRAKLRTLKAPSALAPCAQGGPRAPNGRGKEQTRRGRGAVPPPRLPSSTGTPQCPTRGPRWGPGAAGAAGPGREARAALCPSVSFYGADKEELQE